MTTCDVLEIICKFSILAYSWLFLVRNSGGKSNGDTRKFWNCGIFKLFPKLRKWSWNVFRGEITSVRCFFFRSNIVVNVSPTLKNRHFSLYRHFWLCYKGPCESQEAIFASTKFTYSLRGIEKIVKTSKFCWKLVK